MDDIMLASTIRLAALSELLYAWKVPTPGEAIQPSLMMLESMPRHKIEPHERQDLLRFALFRPGFDVVKYRSGRVFHEDGELRWEELDSDNVQVVYTGTKQYQPDLPRSLIHVLNERTSRREHRHYILFGKQLEQDALARIAIAQEGDFAEVRIPRLLRYPRLDSLKETERVQIELYEYLNLDTSVTQAYRFRSLVPFRMHPEQTK